MYEMVILKTEKAMIRAICGVKQIAKSRQEVINLLGLKDTLNELARASKLQLYGHVLRNNNDVLRRVLELQGGGRKERSLSLSLCVSLTKT